MQKRDRISTPRRVPPHQGEQTTPHMRNVSRCPDMFMTFKIKRFANKLCHSDGGL